MWGGVQKCWTDCNQSEGSFYICNYCSLSGMSLCRYHLCCDSFVFREKAQGLRSLLQDGRGFPLLFGLLRSLDAWVAYLQAQERFLLQDLRNWQHVLLKKKPGTRWWVSTLSSSLLQPRKAGECLGTSKPHWREWCSCCIWTNWFLFCQLEGKVTACKKGLILLTSVKVCSACFSSRLSSSAFIYT